MTTQPSSNHLLGRGLRLEEPTPGLDHSRDLVLTEGPNGLLDFAWNSGIENLGQCLIIALTTLLGSDPFNTGFGFRGLAALAEEDNPIMQREKIRIGIIELLKKDRRIKRIIDVRFTQNELDLLSGSASADSRRTLHIAVQFETITHQVHSISLGDMKPI